MNDQELREKVGKIASEVFKTYVLPQGEATAMVGNTPVAFIDLDGDVTELEEPPLDIVLPAGLPLV